jgi:hypothetical protein
MRQEAEWWRGNHPDAAEHRKHLEITAKEDAERALARVPVRKALPPARPRKKRQPVVEILKNGNMAINEGTVTGADLSAFGEFLKTELAKFNKDVQAAFDKQGKRIEELEARPAGLLYEGIYDKSVAYRKNQGVTANGSVWVALVDNPPREPGLANSGWRLAVKKGRDGKDAKP